MTEKRVGQEFTIEELVKTVSGNAVVKSLYAKKKRYANSIDLAIEKNRGNLTKKKIEVESLRRHLLVLVEAILEKSRFVGEFFKFKMSVEVPKNEETLKQDEKVIK